MRRSDSGWRDPLLTGWHDSFGHTAPAPGMTLPMIEYDDGVPVGIVSYHRRGAGLPKGTDVVQMHEAFGRLYTLDGRQLPFLTAVYDPRNWAMNVFAHNDAAHELVGFQGWRPVVESDFAWMLYRMRMRKLPDLAPFGVTWETAKWLDHEPAGRIPGQPAPLLEENWPGMLMSVRRRCYEPAVPIPYRHRVPCTDVDLAVAAHTTGGLGLVVDYKAPGAKVTVGNTNMRAMGGLVSRWDRPDQGRVGGVYGHREVAAMVVRYQPTEPAWKFEVHCLNDSAKSLLKSVMWDTHAVASGWEPRDWTFLDQKRWLKVLDYAYSF